MPQKILSSVNSSIVTSPLSRNPAEKLKLNVSHGDCDHVCLGMYCTLSRHLELCQCISMLHPFSYVPLYFYI